MATVELEVGIVNFAIVHEVPGRIRVSVGGRYPSLMHVQWRNVYLLYRRYTCVAYPKAGSLAVTFNRTEQDRQTVIDELEALDPLMLTKTDSRELLFVLRVFGICFHNLPIWFLRIMHGG